MLAGFGTVFLFCGFVLFLVSDRVIDYKITSVVTAVGIFLLLVNANNC